MDIKLWEILLFTYSLHLSFLASPLSQTKPLVSLGEANSLIGYNLVMPTLVKKQLLFLLKLIVFNL